MPTNFFKNKRNNLMNPENPNSPFFGNNTLKQGTISNNIHTDYYEGENSIHENEYSLLSNSFNNLDNNYYDDDYSSTKISSSTYLEDDSTHDLGYDYNQEFNYEYSYNGYENDNHGYDAHDNDIYDNFNTGLYDLYENNTFNDY